MKSWITIQPLEPYIFNGGITLSQLTSGTCGPILVNDSTDTIVCISLIMVENDIGRSNQKPNIKDTIANNLYKLIILYLGHLFAWMLAGLIDWLIDCNFDLGALLFLIYIYKKNDPFTSATFLSCWIWRWQVGSSCIYFRMALSKTVKKKMHRSCCGG